MTFGEVAPGKPFWCETGMNGEKHLFAKFQGGRKMFNVVNFSTLQFGFIDEHKEVELLVGEVRLKAY